MRAGNPWYILVLRAGSPWYINGPRAASPKYKYIPRAASPVWWSAARAASSCVSPCQAMTCPMSTLVTGQASGHCTLGMFGAARIHVLILVSAPFPWSWVGEWVPKA